MRIKINPKKKLWFGLVLAVVASLTPLLALVPSTHAIGHCSGASTLGCVTLKVHLNVAGGAAVNAPATVTATRQGNSVDDNKFTLSPDGNNTSYTSGGPIWGTNPEDDCQNAPSDPKNFFIIEVTGSANGKTLNSINMCANSDPKSTGSPGAQEKNITIDVTASGSATTLGGIRGDFSNVDLANNSRPCDASQQVSFLGGPSSGKTASLTNGPTSSHFDTGIVLEAGTYSVSVNCSANGSAGPIVVNGVIVKAGQITDIHLNSCSAKSTGCGVGAPPPPLPTDNSANPTEGPQLECEVSILNPLTWLICPIVTGAQGLVSELNDGINSMMNIKTDKGSAFDTSDPAGIGAHYRTAWNTFRVFATGIIIIGGLLMIISQAAGLEVLDAYTVRKTLPRLLVAAIFITLSWYLVGFLIQLSNDLGNSVRAVIYQPFSSIGNSTIKIGQDGSLVASLVGGVGIYALGIMGLLTFALSALVAVVIGFIILIVRKLIILLLIIVAPLAIACYVLPNTQKGWTLWKDTLTSMLVVFPIISAFIAIGRVFAIIAYTSGSTGAFHVPSNGLEQTFATLASHMGLGFGADNSPGLLPTVEAFASYFLPYLFMKQAFDLAGGLISTVKNGVGNAGGGLQRGLSNYRANKRKLKGEKHAARGQAWRNGNLYKGNNKFLDKAINAPGRGVGNVRNAGFNPAKMRGRMQAGRATHEQQELAEYMDKNAAFGAIKGNDDYLQATMRNMGGGEKEEDWRRYLSSQGYSGQTLEQGVAQIRAAKRGVSNEVFNRAAVMANASTGTGWKEGGPAQMMESINEVAGNDRHTAANMLAQMRSDAGRANRLDLMGSGFGTQIGALEAMHNGTMTAEQANKQVIGGALFTKSPGEYARARGQSMQIMAPHMVDHMKEAHAEVAKAKASGNKEYIYRAERSLAQDYAWIDNLHDTLKHSAPESARILADTVMNQPVAVGPDGNQISILQGVDVVKGDQGHMGQAYQETTKSYDMNRYGAEQAREAVQPPNVP